MISKFVDSTFGLQGLPATVGFRVEEVRVQGIRSLTAFGVQGLGRFVLHEHEYKPQPLIIDVPPYEAVLYCTYLLLGVCVCVCAGWLLEGELVTGSTFGTSEGSVCLLAPEGGPTVEVSSLYHPKCLIPWKPGCSQTTTRVMQPVRSSRLLPHSVHR